jgi:hypothetical protein
MAVRQNAPSVLTSNDVSLRMNGILLLATPAQDDRCVVGPGLPLGRLPNSIEVAHCGAVQPGPFVSHQAALRRCRLNLLVRFCLIACALRGRMDPRHSPSGALTVTPWPKTAKKKFTKTPYSWPPIVLNDRLNLAHSFEKK